MSSPFAAASPTLVTHPIFTEVVPWMANSNLHEWRLKPTLRNDTMRTSMTILTLALVATGLSISWSLTNAYQPKSEKPSAESKEGASAVGRVKLQTIVDTGGTLWPFSTNERRNAPDHAPPRLLSRGWKSRYRMPR